MAKIDSGHSPDDVPRMYREMNARLVKTTTTYSSSEEFDCNYYLNMIAFNISL